jgi:hypothetical protein
MQKSNKILVGIFSLLPLMLMLIYMFVFFSFMLTMFRNPQQEEFFPQMMFQHIGWIFGIGILMGLSTLALLIYFIIHVVNNNIIDSTERIVWVLIFVFVGMIGFPIYWYMRIWKEPLPA